MKLRERTLRHWYLSSKGELGTRSQFFAELAKCTKDHLLRVIQSDLSRPGLGDLRSLSSMRRYSRRNPPSLDSLRHASPNEQTLQWMFIYRGHLQSREEEVIERELPVSPTGVAREGWVDLLVFDHRSQQPILVELKQASANDPLTGVMLEVVGHWAFHIRHLEQFQTRLKEADVLKHAQMSTPNLAIVAPERYFIETLRRSGDPARHNEIRIAAEMIDSLRDHWGLKIRLLAIEDDWQSTGPDFAIHEWEIPRE